MKFEKLRSLKNHVFSTTIKRVEDDDQDCLLEEKVLEDDFGHVEVKVGGKYEAVIEKSEDDDSVKVTAVTSENREELASKINFKFSIKESKVALKMGVPLTFSCDAKEEISRVIGDIKISPLEIAEFKCHIFEDVTLDSIGQAIEVWKNKATTFEQDILDPIHFSLR